MDKPEPRVARSDGADASRRLLEDVPIAERPVTDFNGKVCRRQPGDGQFPTQLPDKPTSGCDYSNLPMNTAELYRAAQQNTVRVLA